MTEECECTVIPMVRPLNVLIGSVARDSWESRLREKEKQFEKDWAERVRRERELASKPNSMIDNPSQSLWLIGGYVQEEHLKALDELRDAYAEKYGEEPAVVTLAVVALDRTFREELEPMVIWGSKIVPLGRALADCEVDSSDVVFVDANTGERV